MESGPLPPHERTWRHPSELAAEEQAMLRAETGPPASRAFALTVGTAGLLAIGVLVMTVTPSRHPQQLAVSATTTPVELAPLPARATVPSSGIRSAPDSAVPQQAIVQRAIATPVGSGRFALVSRAAVADADATMVEVVLPSGRHALVRVVDHGNGTLVVELDRAEAGHDVAEHRPHDREVVTVMSEPPITIAFADIASIDVAEGTAVIDDDGMLVALCTDADDDPETELIELDKSMTPAESDGDVVTDLPEPERMETDRSTTPGGASDGDDVAVAATTEPID